MITAEKIAKLSALKARDLEDALKNSGYTHQDYDRPVDCEFLGITNSNDFCYKFMYREEDGWSYGKLFVNIDAMGKVVAEF